ncbi:MAG TPA: sigma factor-like helix-turn-helix DNA-binding protein [Polyangiaceae bacterium]|nr:sigma factor-like helix-turn-helix DNA-binding protein [Polyangiaceae bacterium]
MPVLVQERQRRLYLHVSKLSSAEQRAISLRYAAGLDYEEIAAIVKRPAATVRSRVFSGLLKLRKLMPKQGEP